MFKKLKENATLLVILGPTASGKTTVASGVASQIKGEVVSADSRQVYKGMNLGTGKDYDDYIVGGHAIKYHLIDIVDAGYKYNVYEYQRDFLKVYEDICKRGKFPVLCGGTGLYIEAVTRGYKLVEVPPDYQLRDKLESHSLKELTEILAKYKKLHNVSDTDTKKRAIRSIEIAKYYTETATDLTYPRISVIYVGIKYERIVEMDRIYKRLNERLEEGMVEEVRRLIERGISPEDMIYYGLEYKYITWYLTGKMNYEEMINRLNIAIRQFAKRQMTWFRKMEREGIHIHWIKGELPLCDKIKSILSILEDEEHSLAKKF